MKKAIVNWLKEEIIKSVSEMGEEEGLFLKQLHDIIVLRMKRTAGE